MTIQWEAEHASSVKLMINGEEVSGLPATGSYTPRDLPAGEVEMVVIAIGNGRESAPVSRMLMVNAPEIAPDPEIFTFSTQKQSIPVRQAFIVEYQVSSSVVSLSLEPYGSLPLDLNRVTIPGVPEAGRQTYVLKARNADGKEVTEEMTLTFVEVVDAKIVRFEANPVEVDPLDGRVTIVWQFANTVSATLTYGDSND